MRGRPGPGALIGLVVGASLVFLQFWLPAALLGDPSTDTGIIVFMGLPLMVVSTAIGGLIGVPESRPAREGHGEAARRPPLRSRALVAIVAGAAVVAAEWFFLMAIGAVPSLL